MGYFQKGIFGWAQGGLVIIVNTSKVHKLCVVKWIRPGVFLGCYKKRLLDTLLTKAQGKSWAFEFFLKLLVSDTQSCQFWTSRMSDDGRSRRTARCVRGRAARAHGPA